MQTKARPARVLHVLSSHLNTRFLSGGLRELARAGLGVWVACPPSPELEQFCKAEGCQHLELPIRREIAPFRDVVAIAALWRTIRRGRFDIVHAHTPKGALVGLAAAWLGRVPVRIYHVHGLPIETARGVVRVLLLLSDKLAARLATHVFAVSPSVASRVVELGLVAASRVRTHGAGSISGVDAAGEFAPRPDDRRVRQEMRASLEVEPDAFVVLFVGRPSRDKGLEELLRAWRAVSRGVSAARLVLAGPVDERDPISPDLERELEATPTIRRLGFVKDVRSLYASADLVVLPSKREGMPGVILEASSMALPVVTTDATGCRDAVRQQVTGLVVPRGDVTCLEQAIRTYACDATVRQQHGTAGRLWMLRDFVPATIWRSYLEEYVAAIAETSR